ncbi:MAG: hypothetical protein WCC64_12005 [Aliidongia sp.]
MPTLNPVEHERLAADYIGDTLDSSALPALLVKGDNFIAAIQTLIV